MSTTTTSSATDWHLGHIHIWSAKLRGTLCGAKAPSSMDQRVTRNAKSATCPICAAYATAR